MKFWDEQYWLPEGMKWSDLRSNETFIFPDFADLSHLFRFTAFILLARLIFHFLLFLPFGRWLGLLDSSRPFVDHVVHSFKFDLLGNTKFKRVSETLWLLTYYTSVWLWGFILLLGQPQLYNINACWENWPYHSIDNQIWLFYMVQTSFYCSLLLSSFIFDVRRSDSLEMMLHHIVTIGLLLMSYTLNFIRVGMLVLSIHDISDIFIQLGKLFRYAGWETALVAEFVIFILVWISARLIYYPFWIIRSLLFDAPRLIKSDYSWFNLTQSPIVPRVVAVMLFSLLILHIYWTYMIMKIAIAKAFGGEISDIREEEDDFDQLETNNKKEA